MTQRSPAHRQEIKTTPEAKRYPVMLSCRSNIAADESLSYPSAARI